MTIGRAFFRCVNCRWYGRSVHPRVYFCLCTECWRPAIIAATLSALVSYLLR